MTAPAAPASWCAIPAERFWDRLGLLPPALHTGMGFLVGEPTTHRTCTALGLVSAAYPALVEVDGRHYEASEPLTRAEFRRLSAADLPAALGEAA